MYIQEGWNKDYNIDYRYNTGGMDYTGGLDIRLLQERGIRYNSIIQSLSKI
jgi:hypothetical protein